MNSIERFFDIWKDNVLGNKDDLVIGLSQLEEEIRADERTQTIDEMAEIITELNDDTTICNSFNCPRADEPITCTMCILERAIKQIKKEQNNEI